MLEFFERAGRNLKAAELEAGVKHHVALSIVGTDRLPESGYFRAKVAQEQLIRGSGVPYTIVHATQFCEFVPAIAESAAQGDTIRLPSAPLQPMAAEEVAAAVVEYALAAPRNGVVEIAGPEPIPLDQLVQRYLVAAKDPRKVVRDEQAGYFGAPLKANTLVPGPGAQLGKITFDAWLAKKYA